MRGEYEKLLVESLTDINTKSKRLLKEADKSHIHEAHLCTLSSKLGCA